MIDSMVYFVCNDNLIREYKMRITYAIDQDTGLVVSRVESELAWPILAYDNMLPENGYAMNYYLEKMSVFAAAGTAWAMLKWTKKISIDIKNVHRAFWGMKLLAE